MANATKGTAFVVFEDVMDAKQACDKLNGFNFQSRYLVGTMDPFHEHLGFSTRRVERDIELMVTCSSAIPSTREAGKGKRRARRTTRKLGSPQRVTSKLNVAVYRRLS